MDSTLDLVRLRVEGRRGLRQERSLTHKELLHPLLSLSMWSEDSNQPAQEAAETHDNFSSLRRILERAGNGKTPAEFHSRHDRGFKLEEQQPDVQQSFSMSLGGTLERGAHHQALDLSEELPLHHSQNLHHQNHLPHHSHSLASPAVVAGRETPSRVVVPPPYCAADGGGGSEAAPELRGSLDCWACSVLVTAQNLVIAAINACLAALVFGTILTPATAMVVFGFLCHSTVRPHGTSPYCSDLLNDGGCVALLVVGFLLVTPLLVLALAAYCRLARHLQLALCFIPYSRAVYKNLPASHHRGLGGGCCCGRDEDEGKGKVWV